MWYRKKHQRLDCYYQDSSKKRISEAFKFYGRCMKRCQVISGWSRIDYIETRLHRTPFICQRQLKFQLRRSFNSDFEYWTSSLSNFSCSQHGSLQSWSLPMGTSGQQKSGPPGGVPTTEPLMRYVAIAERSTKCFRF